MLRSRAACSRAVGCSAAKILLGLAPTMGSDTRFCRSHADHYARHGSPYKPSYTAKEIALYRKAALTWLEANEGDVWVRNAVDRVETLYRTAGPHVEAFRLRGLSPQERAQAAWARLRKAKIDPADVIAAWLAVEMIIAADPQAERKVEFKRVQAAKLVHKMASGTHKRWGEGANSDGASCVPEVAWKGAEAHWRGAGEGMRALLVEHRGKALPGRLTAKG